jgi:uncharacterized protein
MPANVSYEYAYAKKKYDEAQTNEEKLIALQEMASTAPSHKGAENLRKDISRKIASLKSKMEKQAASAKKSGHTINIRKEGAGQVLLVGLPNSGKSTFLQEYTNAKPEIASYPFTTTKPEIGTLDYGGAHIQLIELPSFLEYGELSSQVYSMIRVADAIVLVISDGNISQLEKILYYLENQNIYVTKKKPKVKIVRSDFLGVAFINEQNLLINKEKAINLLKDSGYKSHTFILNQKINMDDLLLLINPRATYLNAICVSVPINNIKTPKTKHKTIEIYDFEDKNEITDKIFNMLNKKIVYTKRPGQKADVQEPLVLDNSESVLDAAKEIHKTIYKNLKSAKVWGSTRYPGQEVSKNYILKNKDIVEFIM